MSNNKKCSALLRKGCSQILNVRLILEYSNLWLACLNVKLGAVGGAKDPPNYPDNVLLSSICITHPQDVNMNNTCCKNFYNYFTKFSHSGLKKTHYLTHPLICHAHLYFWASMPPSPNLYILMFQLM